MEIVWWELNITFTMGRAHIFGEYTLVLGGNIKMCGGGKGRRGKEREGKEREGKKKSHALTFTVTSSKCRRNSVSKARETSG